MRDDARNARETRIVSGADAIAHTATRARETGARRRTARAPRTARISIARETGARRRRGRSRAGGRRDRTITRGRDRIDDGRDADARRRDDAARAGRRDGAGCVDADAGDGSGEGWGRGETTGGGDDDDADAARGGPGGGAGRGKETPESVVRAPMAGGDTLWSPVAVRASVGGGGGLESPERSGGTPTLGGESGDEETREATMAMPAATATMGDGAEGYTYGTPPSSPSARNSAPACPATPFKARRTRQIGADDSSAPRPRGRVVRSLLEEFDAAERGLEDMLGDTHSENTTLRTLDDGFDPFDDPE